MKVPVLLGLIGCLGCSIQRTPTTPTVESTALPETTSSPVQESVTPTPSGFTYPIDGQALVTDGNFGACGCQEYRCGELHLGTDIRAPFNTPVRAVGNGIVRRIS